MAFLLGPSGARVKMLARNFELLNVDDRLELGERFEFPPRCPRSNE
jgi:hypothetical protein